MRWESSGKAPSYRDGGKAIRGRGTDITLHLREDESEFTQSYRLRSIASKFSDHVAIPVEMLEEEFGDEKMTPRKRPQWEQVK